jgi:hypothetical protein
MNNVAEIHIQPTLVETYTKHTQSDITLEQEILIQDDETSIRSSNMDISTATATGKGNLKSPISVGSKRKLTEQEEEEKQEQDNGPTSPVMRKRMTEEEKQKILESEALENFLVKSSRIIERILANGSQYDCMIDYSAAMVSDDNDASITRSSSTTTGEGGGEGARIKLQMVLKDEKWTQFRAVTDIDVSPFYTELIMVSYTGRNFLEEKNTSNRGGANGQDTGNKQQRWDSLEGGSPSPSPSSSSSKAHQMTDIASITEGVVLLWSTALPTRPEYKFTCHSQVTASCFHPFDRHLLFGGTYSGQVSPLGFLFKELGALYVFRVFGCFVCRLSCGICEQKVLLFKSLPCLLRCVIHIQSIQWLL